MSSQLLRIVINNQVQEISLGKLLTLPAEKGAVYSVVDAESHQLISDIVLKKAGENLTVVVNDEVVANIEHYYAGDQNVVFEVTSNDPGGVLQVASSDAPVEGSRVVWSAGENTVAEVASSSGSGGEALAIAAGMFGGAAFYAQSANSTAAPVAPAPANTVITGNFVAGPVVAGNGLSVTLYDVAGNVLGSSALAADGSYNINLNKVYTGNVLARVSDANASADYMNEATGVATDLTTDVRAVDAVSGAGTFTINVTMLTELAARDLGLAGGDKGTSATSLAGITTAQIGASNQSVSTAFGIANITADPIVAAIDATGAANAGVNQYGVALASLSGMENGGQTTNTVLNTVHAGLNNGVLSASVGSQLNQGATVSQAQLGSTVNPAVYTNQLIIAPAASTLAEQGTTHLADGLMNIAEAVTTTFRATLPTTGSTAVAGDSVELLLGGTAFGTAKLATLTAADITNGFVNFTVVTADLGADGAKSLTTQITDTVGNVSTASAAITFTLDTVAPTASTAASTAVAGPGINAAEAAAGVVVASSLAGTNAVAGDSIEMFVGGVSLAPALTHVLTAAEITAGSYNFTIPAGSLGANGAKSITTVVTDIAGNAGAASPALSLTLDTVAPAASTLAEQGTTHLADGLMNIAEAVTTTFRATLPTTGSTAVAGDSVELLLGGTAFGTAKLATLTAADITNGFVDFTVVTADLGADGAKSLTTQITDTVGNVSTASAANTFTLDTVAPTSTFAVVNPIAGSANAQAGAVTLTTETGSISNVVFTNGVNTVTKTIVGVGTAQAITLTAAELTTLGNGTITVDATTTDAAGNTGPAATQRSFVLDTVAPAASTLAEQGTTHLADGLMNIAEAVTTTFRATLPTTGSTAVAGDSVELLLGGTAFGTAKLATLTATDSTNGFVDFTVVTADLGVDGAKSLTTQITDAAGNVGTASTAITFTLDTAAPTATVTSATIANTGNAVVQSSEVGTAYLVDSAQTVATVADITALGTGLWNQTTISAANTNTNLAAIGLANGAYTLYTADASGNLSAGTTNAVTVGAAANTSIVVFDLVHGVNSSHSARTFDPTIAYTIYIEVQDTSERLFTTPQAGAAVGATYRPWGGVANLGSDDTIILVGQGGGVKGKNGGSITAFTTGVRTNKNSMFWKAPGGTAARLRGSSSTLTRYLGSTSASATLFTTSIKAAPAFTQAFTTNLAAHYKLALPTGIATSQGLV